VSIAIQSGKFAGVQQHVQIARFLKRLSTFKNTSFELNIDVRRSVL